MVSLHDKLNWQQLGGLTFNTRPGFSKCAITGESQNNAKVLKVVDKQLVRTLMAPSEH